MVWGGLAGFVAGGLIYAGISNYQPEVRNLQLAQESLDNWLGRLVVTAKESARTGNPLSIESVKQFVTVRIDYLEEEQKKNGEELAKLQ